MGCNKTDIQPEDIGLPLGLSYDINNDEQTLKIAINSIVNWKVYSYSTWCTPDKISGNGNDTLKIKVQFNINASERLANITIKAGNTLKTIQITQSGYVGEYRYKLPVVFHVLYNNPNDTLQNITARTLYTTLNRSNADYKNSIDMKLEFVAATHDPTGRQMSEAGIDRIKWRSSDAMDCLEFMSDPTITNYIWDPNNYINIFIFPFTQELTLGISHLPYTISANPLEGLFNGDHYLPTNYTLTYPHSISLNSKFTYTEHNILKIPDLALTLSHELGHYIGLFHVFGPQSDYCDDTDTYDRDAYEAWISSLTQKITFEKLVQRTTPQQTTFTSHNIMDYDYSYFDQFTPDQKKRVRHVLHNSPLIPGPKNSSNRTKSTNYNEIPQIRTIQ